MSDAQNAATDKVKNLIAERDKAERWEEINRKAKDFCNSQLQAIEDGEFSLSKDYHGEPRIIFDEKQLNRTIHQFTDDLVNAQNKGI